MAHSNAAPLTADAKQQAGVRDTFPASDPVGDTETRGARAVDIATLGAAASDRPHDAIVVDRRFPDAAAAKLALEGIVRTGPFDRAHADIVADGEAALLRLHVTPTERERLQQLLDSIAC